MSQASATTTAPDEPRLSRERILDAALQVAARDGLEALSMRRIAQLLDVWPMSLYRYFHDKDELLEALGEAAAAAIELPPARGGWRERLRALLTQARAAMEGHPAGTRLRLAPDAAPAGRRVSDAATAILVGAGFHPDEAARAARALLSYARGFALDRSGADSDEADFDYGLDCLLDGLALRLRDARPDG